MILLLISWIYLKMQVTKRDGSTQDFDSGKIYAAVGRALDETKHNSSEELALNLEQMISALPDMASVEEVQDRVERVLMKTHPLTARAYILYRDKHASLRASDPDPLAISDYIHASKYARWLSGAKRRETYQETVQRNAAMHIDKFPELTKEIVGVYSQFVLTKKVLPSMRSMQFAGDAIRQHNARMFNCSFTLIDRIEAFSHAFYLLLAGCGVGYSVQTEHVRKLPKIQRIDESHVIHWTVTDNIEGWADSVLTLVAGYVLDRRYTEFNYSRIRPEGAPLKTGGGKAPGHLPLKRLHNKLRAILDGAIGRHLRPIECHDIMCHIAEAVLAGGIRRSSLICLFSEDDEEMFTGKAQGNFDPTPGGLNSHRAMANNSVHLLRGDLEETTFKRIFFHSLENWGEPGFFLANERSYGTNPCGEIGLNPISDDGSTGFQFCNLCEINMARIESLDDYLSAAKAAAFIGTLQASYTNFEYLGQITESVTRKDALLGVGMTGMMDNPRIALDSHNQQLASSAVISENRRVAELIGINPARGCTTVKPSGTASLELGCVGSGIHHHHAKRYFRRITANKNEPIAQHFRAVNPHMVEDKPNGDWVITFPVKAPEGAITIKDQDPIEFLDDVYKTYKNWILFGSRNDSLTHNVSCTVTLQDNDWERVFKHIWENRFSTAALSFASVFSDKAFPYAPREAVETEADEQMWRNLIKNYTPVDYTILHEEEDGTVSRLEVACSGGECEI